MTAATPEHLASQEVFARPEVVAFYETFVDGVLPAEEHVFSHAVRPGARVLDLGVGAGRTTAWLRERASTYVGLDYSAPMVETCRRRFPPGPDDDTTFVVGDASDLSAFADGSFDVVVFSFNGIDCLHPDSARLRCLREIHRVLDAGGIAILSEHNPRALLVRPRPLRGVAPKLALARLARAARESIANVVRLGPTPMVRRGEGYYYELQHGGTWWHAATPAHVVAEVEPIGFERVGEVVGFDHPRPAHPLLTGWYYYTFQKR